MLTGDQDGVIRLVLVGFFSLTILLRLKPRQSRMLGGTIGIVGAGLLGVCLSVSGLIFQVHQFEWLGIILVLYACLRWSLPDRWSAEHRRAPFRDPVPRGCLRSLSCQTIVLRPATEFIASPSALNMPKAPTPLARLRRVLFDPSLSAAGSIRHTRDASSPRSQTPSNFKV